MNKQNIHYDYDNQAWIIDGVYQDCNHPDSMNCNCYGKRHAGELYDPENLTPEQLKAMGLWNGSLKVCDQCGKTLERDMLSLFTNRQVCINCVKANHQKAIEF